MNTLDTTHISDLLRARAQTVQLVAGSPAAARRRAAQRDRRARTALGAGTVVVLGGAGFGLRALASTSPTRVVPHDSGGATTAPPATSSTVPTTQLSAPLALGSSGDEVVALQRQLRQLGFDPGPGDGEFDRETEQTVWAAEALILGRTPAEKTGAVDAALWQRLHEEVTIQPRRTMTGTHVEIYLDLQVAVTFTDDAAVLVTHISSGQLNPDGTPTTFCEEVTIDTDYLGNPLPAPEVRGVCSQSKTPGGVFEFTRRYEGERVGPLGGMYNPIYFNYGISIHGAQNVPVFPASHGGVRIPMHIAEYFPSLVSDGDPVFVWDGLTEPEDQTKVDTLPSFLSPQTTE